MIFRRNPAVNLIVPSGASPRTAAQLRETELRYDEVVQRSTDALHQLKDLADTIDGLLARLEAHVAEQRRFATTASSPSTSTPSPRGRST